MPALLTPSRRAGQTGAVAIVVGLALAVLMGFVGLAIDGGRLYVTKTELQNAADACALAAAWDLTGAPIAAAAFTRADAAGKAVASRHSVNFQSQAIGASTVTLAYADSLTGATWSPAATASGSAKYVRCTIDRTGIEPYLMRVLGVGAQSVTAAATASLVSGNACNPTPMAVCMQSGSGPNFGYTVGDWVPLNFTEQGSGNNGNGNGNGGGGGGSSYTGNFRWIDYNPGEVTPGCSGNGAAELACILSGVGQCAAAPPPVSSSTSCGSGSSPAAGCVGATGADNALEKAYNTRFGLYKGSYDISTSPPDFTGYAYTSANWSSGRAAYSDFLTRRAGFAPAQSSYATGGYSRSSSTQHQLQGSSRRVVTVPVVNCSAFSGGSQYAPVVGYACMLMLDPYTKSGSVIASKLEYLGSAGQAGSPCATTGTPSGGTSSGPKVPALVR